MSRAKEKLIELETSGWDESGRAVGRVDNKVVFVEGALPGERVIAKVVKKRGRFDEARVTEIIAPSPHRIEAKCEYFDRCGGCALQHITTQQQVVLKQDDLLEKFSRIAKIEVEQILPAITGQGWHYRRRGRVAVKFVPGKGDVLVGFREKNGRYVTDMDRCLVLGEPVASLIKPLRSLFSTFDNKQQIPQIEVAIGEKSCVLILRHLKPLFDHELEKLADFGDKHQVYWLLQSGGLDTIIPLSTALTTSGQNPSEGELHYSLRNYDISYRFTALDFVQVNAEINEKLVAKVTEILCKRSLPVFDLFCGLGNFSLPLAKQGIKVTGFELAPRLIELARENARINEIEQNTEFEIVDLSRPEEVCRRMAQQPCQLLLDPPRTGALEVLEHLQAPFPELIVYVSCNPATLARDAGVLVNDMGYTCRQLGIVDMFPHTKHSEVIAIFEQAG